MESTSIDIFTRAEVAKWYKLSERGLRYRFIKKGVVITNRSLTLTDIEYIISKLGKPPFMPPNILPV